MICHIHSECAKKSIDLPDQIPSLLRSPVSQMEFRQPMLPRGPISFMRPKGTLQSVRGRPPAVQSLMGPPSSVGLGVSRSPQKPFMGPMQGMQRLPSPRGAGGSQSLRGPSHNPTASRSQSFSMPINSAPPVRQPTRADNHDEDKRSRGSSSPRLLPANLPTFNSPPVPKARGEDMGARKSGEDFSRDVHVGRKNVYADFNKNVDFNKRPFPMKSSAGIGQPIKVQGDENKFYCAACDHMSFDIDVRFLLFILFFYSHVIPFLERCQLYFF